MSLVTTFRNVAIGALVVGIVLVALGVILPFATGAYEAPVSHPPASTSEPATSPSPDAQSTSPNQPGARPITDPASAPAPSIDTTNLDLITAGGPLGM